METLKRDLTKVTNKGNLKRKVCRALELIKRKLAELYNQFKLKKAVDLREWTTQNR